MPDQVLSVRDTYKARVYEAQSELTFIWKNACKDGDGIIDFYGSMLPVSEPRKFGDIDDVQAFVNAVCVFEPITARWRVHKPIPTVRAREGRSAAHYEYFRNEIAIPPHVGSQSSWAMNELIVLHEVAHYFTPSAAHGPTFVRCYLDLLEHIMSPVWRLLMTRALDERGVPVA